MNSFRPWVIMTEKDPLQKGFWFSYYLTPENLYTRDEMCALWFVKEADAHRYIEMLDLKDHFVAQLPEEEPCYDD